MLILTFNNLTNHFWAPLGDLAALCGLPAFSKNIIQNISLTSWGSARSDCLLKSHILAVHIKNVKLVSGSKFVLHIFDKLIDVHKSTTDSDYQTIVHDLRKELLGSPHISTLCQTFYSDIKPLCINMLSH